MIGSNRASLCLWCLIVLFHFVAPILDKLEGEKCETEEETTGVCRPLSSCSIVLDNIQQDVSPTICNTDEDEPVVCCPTREDEPDDKDENHATTEKVPEMRPKPPEHIARTKSYAKCVEYGEHVYTYEKSPLPNEPPVRKSQCGIELKPLIVGGEPAAPKEFPHMVAVGYSTNSSKNVHWECGGTLISDRYVLTAAHCLLSGTTGEPPKVVRMGSVNLKRPDPGFQERRIVQIIQHPDYIYTKYHDIALLKLEEPVEFTAYVRPACLHVGKEITEENAYATGWGKNDSDSDIGTDDLMKVKLPFVDLSTCNETYGRIRNRNLKKGIVDEWQICAGDYDDDKDTCQGDSGGPLQVLHKYVYCMYDLVGVTSFGRQCGFTPAVYTRVSHYLPWIEKTVWSL